jgi:hypothetical protein
MVTAAVLRNLDVGIADSCEQTFRDVDFSVGVFGVNEDFLEGFADGEVADGLFEIEGVFGKEEFHVRGEDFDFY